VTTITLIVLCLAVALAAVLVYNWLEERARRRDREIVRRIQTYLNSLPPARPW
jgi:type II secretory pathway pseudopilin PulG